MKKRNYIKKGLLVMLGAALLTGCGTTQQKDTGSQPEDGIAEVRTIKIGFNQAGIPYGYVDENKNITGYDIEVLRKVDELLPEYEFEYVPTDSEEAWTGTLEGKYQIAVTNSYYTEERAKNYILPEQFLGVSVGGIVVRAEDADVTDFDLAVEKGMKMTPIKSGDGWQFVVEEYNRNHPDGPIEMELVSSIDTATKFDYILAGRYDFAGMPVSTFEKLVTNEDGELHDQISGKLVCTPFNAVKTYTLINKQETDLAEKINTALKQLYEDGTMSDIAIQFYGENTLEYLE